jgi:hypothetical protein
MELLPMDANPHLYDYAHSLDFRADGTVELLDGAGQLINTLAAGRYSVSPAGSDQATLSFYDLVEHDPYRERAPLHAITPFSVAVVREQGLFALRQHVAWKIADEAAWPCLLFTTRYRFEPDPLAFGEARQAGNLYNMLEGPRQHTAAWHYYPRGAAQQTTAGELVALGIPRASFWDAGSA